jgi:hypothetical protein
MKRKLWILLLINTLIGTNIFGQAIFDYTFTPSADVYMELQNPTVLTDGVVWDEETYLIALGFTFYIGGEGFDTVSVNTNGYLTFVNYSVSKTHVAMVLGNVDLQDKGAGTVTAKSPISYQIDGNIGSQITKIQYKNAGFFDGIASDSVNFQIWIYENLDKIEYRFGQSLISNPNIVFQGNLGAISGLFVANANNLLTGFSLTDSPIFPDTAQFTGAEIFDLPSLNNLIPENTVYTFAHNHPVASETFLERPLIVNVFGNPTIDFARINFVLSKPTTVFMDVFDMNGSRLKMEKFSFPKGENQIVLDLSNYPAGIYLCQIMVGPKRITKKVVKI